VNFLGGFHRTQNLIFHCEFQVWELKKLYVRCGEYRGFGTCVMCFMGKSRVIIGE